MSDYFFTIATAFPQGKFDAETLKEEIQAADSGIDIQLLGLPVTTVVAGKPTCKISFKAAVSTTALDAVVAAHQGDYVPTLDQVEVTNQPKVRPEDGVAYAVPKSGSFGYELCDRDFKVCMSVMDTAASRVVVNGANGTVVYQAARKGEGGNRITLEVTAGETGAGHEDRALAVTRSGLDFTVTFGTDELGASVVPSANEVSALVNSDPERALYYLVAGPGGDGTGAVATAARANLAGGAGPSCEDLRLDTSTLLETSWDEFTQVGVYKDDGAGNMIPCVDQVDADSNAILTAFQYSAFSPYTHDLVPFEIRDGYLVVDPNLLITERWDHRVYAVAAPDIPGHLGGSVRTFDGYLGPAPNGVIDAKNTQAIHLDPAVAPGASKVSVYVYHPPGNKLSHVVRLVSYRQPGTF